jgi:hypothetical protein
LVGAKVRERLAVSKRAAEKMDMERFKKFAALENLQDITGTTIWHWILERTSTFWQSLGYCKLKHHNPWFWR